MGLTVSVGTVNFASLTSSTGQYCMDYNQSPINRELKRFHVPGVLGNYIVRDTQSGGKINIRVRYVNTTVANILGAYKSNRDYFLAYELSITDPAGTSITRCNLDPNNSGPSSEIRPTGSGVFFDVTYQFMVDGE